MEGVPRIAGISSKRVKGEGMGRLVHVMQLVDSINEWVGRIFSFFIFFMIVLLTTEVTLRYVFNLPTIWVWDVTRQLFCATIMLGAGYVLLHHANVEVDVVYENLPSRVKMIADLLGWLLFFFFWILMLWKGAAAGWTALNTGETMATYLRGVTWPVKMLMPVGACLILAQGVVNLIRDLKAGARVKFRMIEE